MRGRHVLHVVADTQVVLTDSIRVNSLGSVTSLSTEKDWEERKGSRD